MLHTYIQLPDTTSLGYSARSPDGTVLVGAVRVTDGGYDVALMVLPVQRWVAVEGFTKAELDSFASLVAGNKDLILRLADAAAQADAREADGHEQGAPAASAGGAGAEGCTNESPTGHKATGSGHSAPVGGAAAVGHAQASAVGQNRPPSAGASAAGAAGSAPDAHSPDKPDDHVHDYQQAASAVLDAASLLGKVAPGTRLGRVVNLAMPAARSVVSAAPGIVEKAAPAVSQAAKAAPEVAEKAAQGLGRLGGKLVHAAGDAVADAADAAKRAAGEFKRTREE